MHKSSLTVVGTGIKFLSQMTLEARAYIEKSDKVLFLVNDPALKQWIMNTNKNSECLDQIYFGHENRLDSYSAITDYILKHLTQPQHICVVMYGHPAVFAKPALDAVIKAKAEGYDAKILPGISAEDCLFADLLIDPGSCGCQSFEATDFLLHQRQYDPNSHLILWQPDVIGAQTHQHSNNATGITLLCERLKECYSHDHEVIVYEAAQYPGLQPTITKLPLQDLHSTPLSSVCTLYIKPAAKSAHVADYVAKLGIRY